MKAKQYAAIITELPGKPTNQEMLSAIGSMGRQFFNEFREICKASKISTDSGYNSLVNEFNQKFQVVRSLVNAKYPDTIAENGFLKILEIAETKSRYNTNPGFIWRKN